MSREGQGVRRGEVTGSQRPQWGRTADLAVSFHKLAPPLKEKKQHIDVSGKAPPASQESRTGVSRILTAVMGREWHRLETAQAGLAQGCSQLLSRVPSRGPQP